MSTITSLGIGSGLDLNGLLNQLEQGERGRLQPIRQQQQAQQVKISAYGELQSAITSFQEASDALADTDLYSGFSASATGDAIEVSASNGAAAGTYQVSVDSLATNGSLATQRMAGSDSVVSGAGGELSLTFEDSSLNKSITIEAGSTLEDVKNAINDDPDAAVTASIIKDGQGYRLSMMSKDSGQEASITGSNFDDLAAGNLAANPGSEVLSQGKDASLTVNGVGITSATNRVEDAIQGVTLNINEVGDSRITMEQDEETVRDAVVAFVEGYNNLKETIGKQTAYGGVAGSAGALLGDAATRAVDSQMRTELGVMVGNLEDEGANLLSDLGIKREVDGKLTLDEDALDEAIAGGVAGVGSFFSGEEGLATRLSGLAEGFLDDDGAIGNAISGAETRIESLTDRHTRMESMIDRTVERYRSQFQQLDGMLAQMNQTSSYLTQQLGGMQNNY